MYFINQCQFCIMWMPPQHWKYCHETLKSVRHQHTHKPCWAQDVSTWSTSEMGHQKCLKNIFQGCVEDANHQFSLQPLDRDMNIDPSLITPSSFILPQFSAPDPTNSCSSHISTQPTTTPQDGLSADSNLDNDNKQIDVDLESNTACNQHLACIGFCTIVNIHS